MEIQKSIETLKGIIDQNVASGKFSNLEEIGTVIDAFNSLIAFINGQSTQINELNEKLKSLENVNEKENLTTETNDVEYKKAF